MTCPEFNTKRVINKHHVLTQNVCNRPMKSVGERIRQAREFRGLSGQQLADLVGYKHQSAIGNLENRATGSGGNNLVKIAQALNFSVQWLLSGPDTNDMRTVSPFSANGAAQDNEPPFYLKKAAPAVSWPFERISPHEYETLTPRQQGQVEGYIRSLIDESNHNKSPVAQQAA